VELPINLSLASVELQIQHVNSTTTDNKKAVLWQAEPRNAAVNFDIYQILQ